MAQYLFERTSKITVHSDAPATSARNADGDFVPMVPGITLTAEFYGEWGSQERMRKDLERCVDKLMSAYQKHLTHAD